MENASSVAPLCVVSLSSRSSHHSPPLLLVLWKGGEKEVEDVSEIYIVLGEGEGAEICR